MQTFVDLFWPNTVDGLTVGALYALVALGYTLVYGVLRLINFAHSEVFMIGTFGALFATRWMGIDLVDAAPTGLALIAAVVGAGLVAAAASGAAAVVLERIAYRPLRRRGADRLAVLISAIGASLFLAEAFARWQGRDLVPFPRLVQRDTLFTLFGADVRTDRVIVVVAAVVLMVLLDRFVGLTRLGRGVRAVAQDAETATLMGVNIDRTVSLTFLLGGMAAGAGGLLYLLTYENTRYSVGFILGIKAFTAAVLGGIGNLRGALLGGLALGLIELHGSAIWGSEWRDVIAFAVLVLVLMFRPTGLLGETLGRARA